MIALEQPDPQAVAAAECESYDLYCSLCSKRFRDI